MREQEDKIKFKPVLGFRPGVYLTVLYSIVLLGIIFFLLVFPGLRKPEAALALKTEPAGAAIRVDGVYMGTSKDKILVSKGRHTLEAVLPGFETASAVHEIPGRVFGSLFFPRRYPVEFTLKSGNPAAVFADAASDFAAWSFGGEPTAAWQIPLSLSEGAYRIGHELDKSATEILQAASRFTVTRAALRDIVRAKMLLDNGGLSPSPAGIADSISGILVFLSENPESAEWLAGLLPPESAAVVKASEWYKNDNTEHHISPPGLFGSNRYNRFELAGLSFVDADGFMISETQVPRALFETFLNEIPSWREDDIYPDAIAEGTEITGVSWYAAEAFCQWLTKRLPSSMADMEIRLPTEDEYYYALRSGARIIRNRSNWEWCADPYAPLNFIKVSPEAARIVGSPERSLFGSGGTDINTRASLPPDFTSPFVTFRPVIAYK